MTPNDTNGSQAYLAILGAAAAVAAFAAAFAAMLCRGLGRGTHCAAEQHGGAACHRHPARRRGPPHDPGDLDGHAAARYEFRWYRCQGEGAPDASDCTRIPNANNGTYILRQADAGFRVRSQVVARNGEGQDTATSSPTGVINPRGSRKRRPSLDLGDCRRRQPTGGEPG